MMEKKIINLNGEWKLSSPDKNIYVDAQVPGSIYNDLLENKIIPDPFYRDNEQLVKSFMNSDYIYEKTFYLEEISANHKYDLVLEGIDTLGEIYLNDSLILNIDNMHRTYVINLNNFLRSGKNQLKIIIKSPLKYIEDKNQNYPIKLYQAHDSVPGYIHLRKAHYMFGWDWGPQLPDGGIFRDIYIEKYLKKIDKITISQNHEIDRVKLSIDLEINGFKEDLSYSLTVLNPDNSLYANITSRDNLINLEIINPQKWFPHGYGEQKLYKLIVKVFLQDQLLDEISKKIGLREVKLKQETDKFGESFTFVINGIEVFAKGSNYIPEDNLLARTKRSKTQALLIAAKEANHNMIRVWGGGIYPPDYFYEICDELGLMVWQDLMFACSIYPMDRVDFVENIKLELIDNLTRIRNHPCVVLICGNNENETAVENWNIPSLKISKEFYIKQYLEIIPEIVKDITPEIPYWRSSPASKTLFEDTNADSIGDMHYWGVWHNNEPFTNYRKYYPRFMSEFGLQSFPEIKTVNEFTIESDRNIFSYVMEKHQKNSTANSKILDYLGKLFKYPKDFASLLYVSQAIQAEGIRYGVEHWRRNYGRCMGILYWQLNDCWPVASWSSIDYYHRWKILHYSAKKFYAPVLISAEETKENVLIYLTNDNLTNAKGEVKIRFYDFNGNILFEKCEFINVKSQSSKLIDTLKLKDFDLDFKKSCLYLEFSNEKEVISENFVFFEPDKYLELEKSKISYKFRKTHDDYHLILSTDKLAKFVKVEIDNEDIVFSDNYFHLIPGKEKVISFTSSIDLKNKTNQIKITSLYDSY